MQNQILDLSSLYLDLDISLILLFIYLPKEKKNKKRLKIPKLNYNYFTIPISIHKLWLESKLLSAIIYNFLEKNRYLHF